MTTLLAGIVGSTAYGLAGPDSDTDRLGVYAAPTLDLCRLYPPPDRRLTVSTTGPDVTLHEVGKFARLALGGNPTVSELMWLTDDLYEVRTELGDQLIAIRHSFLCADRVRDAYLGYAGEQFRRLIRRGDGSFSADTRKRTAKHARHLMRLCHQGLQLYRTGAVEIRLADPQAFHDFGERVADGRVDVAQKLMAQYETSFDEARSPLPNEPDEATVERWLLAVRRAHWDPDGLR